MRGEEQWLFSRFRLAKVLLYKVEKVTHTAADSLVWLSALAVDSHSAAHQYYDTFFSTVHTRVLACLESKGLFAYWPLLPDTHHSSDVPSIELEKLDCFPLPFIKEVRDAITACDRVYTEKGSHEAVFNIPSVELNRKISYSGRRSSFLFT